MGNTRTTERRDDGRVQPSMRRQRGCEHGVEPPPVIHRRPTRRAMGGARVALFLTAAAWCLYFAGQMRDFLGHPMDALGTIEAAVYLVLVTLLAGSAGAYLLARLGHLQRARGHHRLPRAVVDTAFDTARPSLTVIVPSYREERRVIRQTLLSAALQEYPHLRVVLLVDDPPHPSDERQRELLEGARTLPDEIAQLLAEPRERFEAGLEAFEETAGEGMPVDARGLEGLAESYGAAAAWLRDLAAGEVVDDHVDAFLVNEVILGLAADLATVAGALHDAARAGAEISIARGRQLHRRLAWIFRADVESFERKRFASLSDEPNKAMNLNSYIGLMGGRYRIRDTRSGTILLPVRGGSFDLEVPDADYVLTLDADSMLLPEYCLRLVAFMERPENTDVGVVQTPYSAYRGAPTRIERIAGATTDLQHIVHQGLARYGAAAWVGANAVLRKRALDDVMVEQVHNGFTTRRYIQDRTPVEDTESTMDLRLHGWRLENYPERLSYSATPPDFGALCVQRQRWANGGLVILPSLFALVRRRARGRRRAMAVEAFLRLNYLASIAWASLGLWLLLLYPFDQRLLSSAAVFTALPYFTAMATDLRRAGYRRLDVLRLYGFNIMLLPVNTVGVGRSIAQAISGQKAAFARTPKVRNRTVAPALFVVAPFLVAGWSGVTLLNDIASHAYLHATFAGFNAVLTLYAILALHGVRHSVSDIVHDLYERLYRPAKQTGAPDTAPDWVTTLYYGAAARGETPEGAAMAGALAAMDEELPAAREIALAADGPTIGAAARRAERRHPHRRPSPMAQSVSGADTEALAQALAESIQELQPGGTLVMRMTEDTLEIHAPAAGRGRTTIDTTIPVAKGA